MESQAVFEFLCRNCWSKLSIEHQEALIDGALLLDTEVPTNFAFVDLVKAVWALALADEPPITFEECKLQVSIKMSTTMAMVFKGLGRRKLCPEYLSTRGSRETRP